MTAVIAVDNLVKTFGEGGNALQILKGISLSIHEKDFCAIVGASGSGKSTFLNILACLDRPSAGSYTLNGRDVSHMTDDELSAMRNRYLGFVFQSFNLIAQLTAIENVELPLFYFGMQKNERQRRSREMLEMVGMGHRLNHFPAQLSGGEKQRVAIARALVNDPVIVLADEPTGNLDSKTGAEIMKLFWDLHSQGRTLVIVTHDPAIAASLPRCVRMKDGLLVDDNQHAESHAQ